MASIYGLYDRDGALRYIGKANNPQKRLAAHMRDSRRRDTPVYRWIRKNGQPEIRVLEADCLDWEESERRLIAEARARGEKLLNVASGGDQPFCSPETRSMLGHRLVKKIREDDEFRKIWHIKRQMRQALNSGYVSNKARAKLRYAAAKAPHLFGCFANVPDRLEDENGEPVGGYQKFLNGRYGYAAP